jgi:hypothetical protein
MDKEGTMPSSTANYPTFSWSHTRDRLLGSCARRYYYRYYLAHGGWHRDASPSTRQAYVLTQLTTLELTLGTSLHARAREIASAIATGSPRPTLGTLHQRVRADLNRVYSSSRHPKAFLQDPRGHPMLLNAYYGRGVSEQQIAKIRERIDTCLKHLVYSPVWATLKRCPQTAVRVIDEPVLLEADGVPVWVAPDLVYTAPGERTTIVDWKTGKEDTSAADQLCLYAWYVRDVLGLPIRHTGYEGRVVELATGTEWFVDLTTQAIEDARSRLHTSVAAMRELLEGPEYERPKPIESFPLAEQRGRCPSCNYRELCAREIQNAGPGERNSLDEPSTTRPICSV